MSEADQAIKKAREIVERCRPIFAGNSPDAIGIALMDLVATWLAGHHPALRTECLRCWLEALPGMITENEKVMFGDRGHPGRLDS
jgi:hypothetical protein